MTIIVNVEANGCGFEARILTKDLVTHSKYQDLPQEVKDEFMAKVRMVILDLVKYMATRDNRDVNMDRQNS